MEIGRHDASNLGVAVELTTLLIIAISAFSGWLHAGWVFARMRGKEKHEL